MTQVRRTPKRRALAAALVALVAATHGTDAVAAGPRERAAAAAGEQTLAWGECPASSRLDPRQQCASLTVPRDYRAPAAGSIEIAVSRIATATPQQRRGILVFNPGGPGSSGINGPSRLARTLPPAVLERYDVVGFDPRGIRYSAPVSCGLAPADLDVHKFIPYPAADLDISANVAYARRAAAGCGAASGDLLPHITTANTARDMDAIRAALGEPRLSYIGYSYGSYLGAVYTTLFPQRADRIVLDSSIHPRRIWRGTFAAWGYAVELAFDGFARFAAERHAQYGLGATPPEVHEKVVALARELEREPFAHPAGIEIDGDSFRELIRNDGLRNDRSFPSLAELIALIDARDATPAGLARAQRLLDALGFGPAADEQVRSAASPFPTPPADNDFAAPWAVVCGDADWPSDPATYQAQVRAFERLFPLHGRAAANIWPCAYWPVEPREPAVSVGALSSGRALVVQSVRDPATPYDGAVAMRDALGSRARLVAVQDGAHSISFNAINTCADAHTAAFLAEGRLPARDVVCHRDAPPAASAGDPPARPLDDAGLLSAGDGRHAGGRRPSAQTVWTPRPGTTWQWQIVGEVREPFLDVDMYDIDLEDAVPTATTVDVPGFGAVRWGPGENAGVIDRLHAAGKIVVCYLDTGAWERYRPDASLFPGKPGWKSGDPESDVILRNTGWAGENWLDIRRFQWPKFAPLMWARFDLAARIGCDGVEPDQNNPLGNKPGPKITAADQKAWYLEVARQAHARGLSVGMKNGVETTDAETAAAFDWNLNEECLYFEECDTLRPFADAGKAIFTTEYTVDWGADNPLFADPVALAAHVCPQMRARGYSTLVKDLVPDTLFVPCW